jgi:hypothetical protein
MERRAASHTEEEEMNQRRRLLNAAKKGDQKAVAKLFELYQVRVYSNEMVNKLNRQAGMHRLPHKGAHAAQAKGISTAPKSLSKSDRRTAITSGHAKKSARPAPKKPGSPTRRKK